MTTRKEQQEKVRMLLKNAVTGLCRRGLGSTTAFSVEALIGITLEDGDVMLISINETIDDCTVTQELETHPDEELLPSGGQEDDPTWPKKKKKLFACSLGLSKKRKGRMRRGVMNSHHAKAERQDEDVSLETGTEKLEQSIDNKHQMADEGSSTQAVSSAEDCLYAGSADSHTTDSNTMAPDNEASIEPAHLRIPHIGPYKCAKCAVVYRYRKCLVEHYLKVHQKTEEQVSELRDWPCHECNRVFPSKRSLTRHVVIHSADRQRHRCQICGKTFSCKRHVDFHVVTVHQGHYPFVCDLCGKQVTTKAALEGHMASKHLINKVKCEKCNREYARPAALASHVCTQKPARVEETVCRICKKSFDLPKRLTQHMAKHSEPRFQCEQCGRNFKWASSLQAHKVAAHSVDSSESLQQQPQQLQQQQLQQQQTHQENPQYSVEPNTMISSTAFPPFPKQVKETQVPQMLTLNELSMFTPQESSEHCQVNKQLTEADQLVSVMSTLPPKLNSQQLAEETFSHPHTEHATEVTPGADNQPYLPGLPASAGLSHVQDAWHASFLNEPRSITSSQIEPAAQQPQNCGTTAM